MLAAQGRGWEPGQVKRKLQSLIDKYADVPKKPAYTYQGGPIGARPHALQTMNMKTWRIPKSVWRASKLQTTQSYSQCWPRNQKASFYS